MSYFRYEDVKNLIVTDLDVNYYPMLLFVVCATLLSVFVARFFVGVIFRNVVFRINDNLSEKIIERVKNFFAGILVFVGFFILLTFFFYEDSRWWHEMVRVIITMFVIYSTIALMSISRSMLRLFEKRRRFRIVTRQTLSIFLNVSNILFILISLYVVFTFVWGVNMTAFLASMGIVGLAFSFAAKDTIANFLSGIFIMIDQPYRVGDVIDLEDGQRGEVVNIGMRSTRVLTMSNVEIIIPNSIIGNEPVINESGGASRKTRVDVDVLVAYGANVRDVKELLVACAQESGYIEDNPVPFSWFVEFGESGMRFMLLCWVAEAQHRGIAIDDLNTRIYDALNEKGIEIPYNKHDIYIKENISCEK